MREVQYEEEYWSKTTQRAEHYCTLREAEEALMEWGMDICRARAPTKESTRLLMIAERQRIIDLNPRISSVMRDIEGCGV
jgi:hypothetical protein